MSATQLTLLPYTTFGTPSGNYDGTSPDFNGTPVPASSYYRAQGIETVRYDLDNFAGNIYIEATLDTSPSLEDSNWFLVTQLTTTPSPITVNSSVNVIGNFVWVRARVADFTAGTINNITLVY